MIGIKNIGCFIPDETIDNVRQAESFGEDFKFIESKIGAEILPRASKDQDASDLGVLAVKDLMNKESLELDEIEALVVVTQNGDFNGLPHTSALIHGKLGLGKKVSSFDISLGCSGYVYGLSILKAHMQEMGFKNAVLVTADPYSKIIDPSDRVTTLLFGDAATATLLSEEAILDIGRPVLSTDGSGFEALVNKAKLKMDGRKVFTFAATEVPKQISDYLNDLEINRDSIDVFLLHQGSAAIIEVLMRKLGQPIEKVPVNLKETGNTVSSSIPLMLMSLLFDSDKKNILISGFGVGLSWATNLLIRR